MKKKENPRPSLDEIYETLKRTSLPTVLVEGVDDIYFYRRVEEELSDIGVDMLPVGNKDGVLALYERIQSDPISAPVAYVVDKDEWVYFGVPEDSGEIITTNGYSIENDLFSDGDLISLLTMNEKDKFNTELELFLKWYTLSLVRNRVHNQENISYREHPNKVLDDQDFYEKSIKLNEGEDYPDNLYSKIHSEYHHMLRGKSLLSLLIRIFSNRDEGAKYSRQQLIEFGASRKSVNYQRICNSITKAFSTRNPV
ncbi:DUF4435 domain-containing protein [Escherichia coli]|jgi:hypothetical protein|uniref:DUF4435 domain-containing protein n=1 Tax=Escherichia coli TaxID=562 RepID=UPI001EE0A7A6|nr:DUF4435 domain-containing protein [Escherichia coli]MCG3822530.1 DUF4435 domain-containing protein [Escherichia coli]HBB7252476.1 DUF4435 domain-containing protein [Escherichia coli]HCK1750978.1 DUF4435 domain-containing protein [Escherichia coli]